MDDGTSEMRVIYLLILHSFRRWCNLWMFHLLMTSKTSTWAAFLTTDETIICYIVNERVRLFQHLRAGGKEDVIWNVGCMCGSVRNVWAATAKHIRLNISSTFQFQRPRWVRWIKSRIPTSTFFIPSLILPGDHRAFHMFYQSQRQILSNVCHG